jgi:hypothetical protein
MARSSNRRQPLLQVFRSRLTGFALLFGLSLGVTTAAAQDDGEPRTLAVLRPVSRTAEARLLSAAHARLRTHLSAKQDLSLVDQRRLDTLWQRKWNRSVALEDVVGLGRELWAGQVLVWRIEKTASGFEGTLAAVDVEQEGILAEERLEADTEREFLNSVTAVAERIYSRRNQLFSYPDQFLFLSMFVPGKAQWQYGSRLKGGFFFAAVVGLFVASALYPDGDPYFGVGALAVRAKEATSEIDYYIGGREVTREEFIAEAGRRRQAEASRNHARRRKRLLRYTGLIVHAVNLVDAFLLGRRYQEERLSRWALRVKTAPFTSSNFMPPGIAVTVERSF